MNHIGQAPQSITPFGREQMRDIPAVRVIPYEYVADFALQGGTVDNVGNLVDNVAPGRDQHQCRRHLCRGLHWLRVGRGACHVAPIDHPSRHDSSHHTQCGQAREPPARCPDRGFQTQSEYECHRSKPNGQLNGDLPVTPETFQRLKSADNFSFLLSIVDTATGRELQNRPVHSLATLGGADGRRPFKMLPQPMVFLPRSTIRLQVEELTKGVGGRLFITLQGYKILGLAGALEEETRRFAAFDPLKKIPVYDHETGNYRPLGEMIEQDVPTTRAVPFDYVSTLDLSGRKGNIVEDEVPINVDGGYVATAINYSLDIGDTEIEIVKDELSNDENEPIDLGDIKLTEIRPMQALFDGIRIHPLRTRFAFRWWSTEPHRQSGSARQNISKREPA